MDRVSLDRKTFLDWLIRRIYFGETVLGWSDDLGPNEGVLINDLIAFIPLSVRLEMFRSLVTDYGQLARLEWSVGRRDLDGFLPCEGYVEQAPPVEVTVNYGDTDHVL